MSIDTTKTWTTVPKDDWGRGPWQHEPDKIQWYDEDTGMACLIVRGPFGALCGYVGVESGHPLHGVHHDECGAIYAHGDINYSAPCAEVADESRHICHVPAPGRSDKVWWFGFDCAHAGDISPATLSAIREVDEELARPLIGDTYRTVGYVRDEVRRLARQLADVGDFESA